MGSVGFRSIWALNSVLITLKKYSLGPLGNFKFRGSHGFSITCMTVLLMFGGINDMVSLLFMHGYPCKNLLTAVIDQNAQ